MRTVRLSSAPVCVVHENHSTVARAGRHADAVGHDALIEQRRPAPISHIVPQNRASACGAPDRGGVRHEQPTDVASSRRRCRCPRTTRRRRSRGRCRVAAASARRRRPPIEFAGLTGWNRRETHPPTPSARRRNGTSRRPPARAATKPVTRAVVVEPHAAVPKRLAVRHERQRHRARRRRRARRRARRDRRR